MCMLHFYYNIKCIKSKIKYFNKIYKNKSYFDVLYKYKHNSIEENILLIAINLQYVIL